MKNRKMLIILVPAVLVIWGAVIYSIFSHIKGSGINIEEKNSFIHRKKSEVDTNKYALMANYRDPFGTGNRLREDDLDRENLLKNQHIELPVYWPQIEYRGLIVNNKKWVALLRIDNSNYLLHEGEEKMSVKLIKMFNDSVVMRFQKATKTFTKLRKQ
jgi:hypothetical protein